MAHRGHAEGDGGPLSKIAQEHRELRRTLELLEKTQDPLHLASLLTHLNGQLAAHFAEEEADDGLAAIVEKSAPQHLVHLDRLFTEHRDFESRIRNLADSLHAMNRQLNDVRHSVKELCQALRDHEERESSLITEAVYTDIGPGD